jgi:hypothetical protein
MEEKLKNFCFSKIFQNLLLWQVKQVEKKSDALLLKKMYCVVVFVFVCEYLTVLRMRTVNVYDQMKTEEVIFDTLSFLLENLICAQIFLNKYVNYDKSQQLYRLLNQLKSESINLRLYFETLLLLASLFVFFAISWRSQRRFLNDHLLEYVLLTIISSEALQMEIVLTILLQTVTLLESRVSNSMINYFKLPSQEIRKTDNGDLLIVGWFKAILDARKNVTPQDDIKTVSSSVVTITRCLLFFNQRFTWTLTLLFLHVSISLYQNVYNFTLDYEDFFKLLYHFSILVRKILASSQLEHFLADFDQKDVLQHLDTTESCWSSSAQVLLVHIFRLLHTRGRSSTIRTVIFHEIDFHSSASNFASFHFQIFTLFLRFTSQIVFNIWSNCCGTEPQENRFHRNKNKLNKLKYS